MSRPANFTAPSSGFTTPTTMLNVVVLPAPFGPSSPTISPAPTATETPLTTRRPRYSFASFSVASSTPFVCDAAVSIQGVRCDWGGTIIWSRFVVVPGGKFVMGAANLLVAAGT